MTSYEADEDTQITVEIRADQDIESIEYAVDGEVVSTEETYTIEPEEHQPGEYELEITVEDVEGDIGELSTEFEIAALPPTVADDFETAAEDEIADAEVISVDAGGQTEITQVEFVWTVRSSRRTAKRPTTLIWILSRCARKSTA